MRRRRAVGQRQVAVRFIGLGLVVSLGLSGRVSGQAPAPAPPGSEKGQEKAPTGSGTVTVPGPPAVAVPGGEPEPRQVADLSTRYRFVERYTAENPRPGSREIGQYRVGSRDVIRVVAEKPQGTPDRTERTVQIIYSERPAAVNGSGAVTDTVRQYEEMRVTPAPEGRPSVSAPVPLKGLKVWNKIRPSGAAPLLIALGGNRKITETEYNVSMRQIFLPDLAGLLPSLPRHVGDRWSVPRGAATQALMGEKPMQGSELLVATLIDVRPSPGEPSKEKIAFIGVTGRALLPQSGDTRLNAQVQFTFANPEPAAAEGAGEVRPSSGGGPDPRGSAGAVDAFGAITSLRLARSAVSAVPGSSGRLKLTKTWELILQRAIGAGAGQGSPALEIPNPPPAENEENSWLTYHDLKGRFQFRHPQDYLPLPLPPGVKGEDDDINLVDANFGTNEGHAIRLGFQPPTGNAEADRAARDPETHIKGLSTEWDRSHKDVLRGPAGWLPDAEWSKYKMRVYRIEAALRPSGPENRALQRIFLDYYVVQFTTNESLVIEAMTGQDPPVKFRNQVETILRTFQVGPNKVAVPVSTPPSSVPAAAPARNEPRKPGP